MLSILISAIRGLLLSNTIRAARLPQQPLPQSSDVLPRLSPDFLGNSPLGYCNESRPTDLFWLDRIDVEPEHLYIDDIFRVALRGFFTSPILANSTWTSTARGVNSSESEVWTQPFCDMIASIDQSNPDREPECPPEQGWAVVMMEGWVWEMFIVPGDYYFKFDAINGDGKRIYCLETEIRFDYRDGSANALSLKEKISAKASRALRWTLSTFWA